MKNKAAEPGEAPHRVGVLNEKPLHAALKQWYAESTDRLEVSVDGFVVDIVRGELLVEIQARNFAAIKRKLSMLTEAHDVRLVYPIALDKWIVRLSEDGSIQLSRRRSPKRGAVEDVFNELISFPELVLHPRFSLEVLLIQEEEARHHDRTRAWRRRGWVTTERRLLRVIGRRLFQGPGDLAAFVPSGLAEAFTTSQLATAIDRPRRLAQRMVYCLRRMGCIEQTGKSGSAILYSRCPPGALAGPLRLEGQGDTLQAAHVVEQSELHRA